MHKCIRGILKFITVNKTGSTWYRVPLAAKLTNPISQVSYYIFLDTVPSKLKWKEESRKEEENFHLKIYDYPETILVHEILAQSNANLSYNTQLIHIYVFSVT